jgi:hypothetical protein
VRAADERVLSEIFELLMFLGEMGTRSVFGIAIWVVIFFVVRGVQGWVWGWV